MDKSRSIIGKLAVIGLGAIAAAAAVAAYKYRKEISEYAQSWGNIQLKKVSHPSEHTAFEADLDNDGAVDTVYLDSNDDGVADTAFVDTDADGKVDIVLVDTDADGEMDTVISGEEQ